MVAAFALLFPKWNWLSGAAYLQSRKLSSNKGIQDDYRRLQNVEMLLKNCKNLETSNPG
jgi:hypothetical protein